METLDFCGRWVTSSKYILHFVLRFVPACYLPTEAAQELLCRASALRCASIGLCSHTDAWFFSAWMWKYHQTPDVISFSSHIKLTCIMLWYNWKYVQAVKPNLCLICLLRNWLRCAGNKQIHLDMLPKYIRSLCRYSLRYLPTWVGHNCMPHSIGNKTLMCGVWEILILSWLFVHFNEIGWMSYF